MPEYHPQLDRNPKPAALIEAALETYPVAPTPEGFSKRVMLQVRQLEAERRRSLGAAPRFRLEFLDLALPVFFAFFGMLVIALPLGALALVDPLWLLRAQLGVQIVMDYLPTISYSLQTVLAILGVLAVTGGAVALLVAYFWLAPFTMEIRSTMRRV
jgi:hypothetical protein